MLNTYFKSLLVPSIHYGPNPYEKISKLYTTHPQFLNVDFPAISFSIMLVDGGFFWLICQCLFLNAPTMYYYHVGGNNITNLSLCPLQGEGHGLLVSEVDGQGAAVCAIVSLSLVGVDALGSRRLRPPTNRLLY